MGLRIIDGNVRDGYLCKRDGVCVFESMGPKAWLLLGRLDVETSPEIILHVTLAQDEL